MACIAFFDDMYSQSLRQHPIRDVVGKHFYTSYRRCMYFESEWITKAIYKKGGHHDLLKDKDANAEHEDEVARQGAIAGGPRRGDDGDAGGDGGAEGGEDEQMKGGHRHRIDLTDLAMLDAMDKTRDEPHTHFFFVFLRFIQKTIRVFYMSFFFYFAPFSMLLYQYYLNYETRQERIEEQGK